MDELDTTPEQRISMLRIGLDNIDEYLVKVKFKRSLMRAFLHAEEALREQVCQQSGYCILYVPGHGPCADVLRESEWKPFSSPGDLEGWGRSMSWEMASEFLRQLRQDRQPMSHWLILAPVMLDGSVNAWHRVPEKKIPK